MLCLAGPGSARSDFSLVQACTSGGCEAVGALQCFRDKATMCAVGKNCRDSFVPQAPDAVDRGWLRTGHPDGQPKMGAIIATAFECADNPKKKRHSRGVRGCASMMNMQRMMGFSMEAGCNAVFVRFWNSKWRPGAVL
eukprot:1158870-Pelagomonas_calceolata.AAC.1